MPWVLEQFFGPNVPENPNYEIIQDISSLVLWWYPYVIAGCTILLLILLWAKKRRRRRTNFFLQPGRRNQSDASRLNSE